MLGNHMTTLIMSHIHLVRKLHWSRCTSCNTLCVASSLPPACMLTLWFDKKLLVSKSVQCIPVHITRPTFRVSVHLFARMSLCRDLRRNRLNPHRLVCSLAPLFRRGVKIFPRALKTGTCTHCVTYAAHTAWWALRCMSLVTLLDCTIKWWTKVHHAALSQDLYPRTMIYACLMLKTFMLSSPQESAHTDTLVLFMIYCIHMTQMKL